MNSIKKGILSGILIVFIIMCFMVFTPYYIQPIQGYSMNPTITGCDVLIMENVEQDEKIKVGEIYSYNYNETIQGEHKMVNSTVGITHRLVHKNGEYDKYILQGDNNSIPDPPAKKKQIYGKHIYTISISENIPLINCNGY